MPPQVPDAHGAPAEDQQADAAAVREIHETALRLARSLDPGVDEILDRAHRPMPRPARAPGRDENPEMRLRASLRMLIYVRREASRVGMRDLDLDVVDACIDYLSRRPPDDPPLDGGERRSLH
jgi:hypothetical protein